MVGGYGIGRAAPEMEEAMATTRVAEARTQTPRLTATQMERYSRQIILEEMGVEGQSRLLESKVLIVGAGGLGSPTALYLAAAGVGTLGIVDGDQVDLTNLHRQILHATSTLGRPKTESARQALGELNPDVTVVPYQTVLTSANAFDILAPYDVVINGSDNFPTRYLVNDACVLLGKPLVDASILKWEGQATTFLPGRGCYRCLFPTPPPPGAVPSCAEGGILGALCGSMGSRQALETLKVLLGVGETLANRLLIFDALEGETRVVRWNRNPQCPVCGDQPTIHALIDYEQFCGMPAHDRSATPAPTPVPQVSPEEAKALLDRGGVQLVDVREPWEHDEAHIPGCRLIPLGEVPLRYGEIARETPVVVYCKSGGRSAKAVAFLLEQGYEKSLNLSGGILAWANAQLPIE
jgi:molybdopterin/thiamine biosynthesis adenylyltransferase/rhodanese-related sulfurtransferase